MSGPSSYNPQNAVLKWVERRLPIGGLIHSSFVSYPTPRNLNYWWTFGAILSMMLGIQIITGIILAMHYTPHADLAFKSVEAIMRDVNYGWLLRYLHSNGASMFFIAVYVHMFRGLYYGSYKEPREILWILGVIIYLLMMATGFMGYVLPWGQMSFWGATVITNLFSAIPYVGESIVTLLWGGYSVGNPTLNRFFSLHYLLPFVIAGVVVLHIWALHVVGQNNPAGVEPQTEKDTVPFTPYATIKDAFGMCCFLLFFAWFLFYTPNFLGDPDNYIVANPGVTPAHIVPEWYYLPFYAILRSIPSKLGGVVAMFSAILVLAFLPWLDGAKARSSRYRPMAKQFFWIFVVVCLVLGWLGAQPPEGIYVIAGRIFTAYYFFHFLVLLPILSRVETARPLPNSIADDVLGKGKLKTVASVLAVFGLAGLLLAGTSGTSRAEDAHSQPTPPSIKWSFAGPLGKFDQGQLQRGLKVYKEVCSNCHSLNYIAFRNIADPGGPGYSEAQAASLASEYKIKDGPNDQGEMFERPGRPADYFPAPFPNDQAARAANGGALPPDLSLMAKARGYERGFPQFLIDLVMQFQEKGPNYIAALLQGYEDAPKGFALPAGSNYNKYFPGHALGMPKPLSDGQVTYDDGSPQTVQQYATDVAAFLMWTAEPKLEARKKLGLQVFIFLIVLSFMLYFTKRKVWANAH
ncbi:cytochrome b N-terminal domain-containing protein [Bradyrhizobium sp. U87765 SZCCT0131]|uniref:cytochrome c1 n=1 Tax=unclassified Bradyrhizobium TaxID=2631580 RepID=UPI001BA55C55|nr:MULTISPECIES: cytochrome c1 [unclassified Bradyrhizobium]MBR1218176.1 cytochrome b N-terminal domain-containing protein [Bradyrhizobium sp. U87765 SZCCT0131]MBR1260878.1 cytochrome b N-terminal domain-containing protein [Bradyrhizobium sp. U87765 SZCCT0134]MBR1303674.1 cytochrome b N-terminal domain-containing protein [Bradyrhizobium sp. U87765 SZCCT0110]MBR1319280.1 cytochrome b N-terminal domain-containing protein [Bradyrhizobium sp. U87765 SZCCT0109]MBR1347605.1 cytochrome b N-terminal d